MKKLRAIQFLCSMLIILLLMLAIFAGLVLFDRLVPHKPQLVITSSSVQAEYDGTPLTNHQWNLAAGELKDGHKIVASFTDTQTDTGISENTMTVEIVDEDGNIVTSEYGITYQYGTLQVSHRPFEVDAAVDFENLTPVGGKYTLSDDELGLLDGHYAVVTVENSTNELGLPTESITSVVIYDENGNDITYNYQVFSREKGEAILIPAEGIGNGSISTSLSSPPPAEAGDHEQDTPLFSVLAHTDATVYFRTQSCGDYLGNGWDDANAFPGLYDDAYAASYLTSFYLSKRNVPLQEIEIISYISDYPLPYYMASGGNYTIQRNDTLSIGSSENSYTVPFYLFDATTLSPVQNNDVFENAYRQFVYENYTSIDLETLDFMNQIIATQHFSTSTPTLIQEVASYIQNAATYNLDYNRKLDEASNNAIAFLSTYKEGVCRHYATAATLLFRALGFPARFTVGAVATLASGQWVDVMPSQAHAWVEVYLDGIGWVVVEVTPPSFMEGGGHGHGHGPSGNEAGQPAILNLAPKALRKKYDGTPLYSDGLVTGLEKLERLGYTYAASISGSQTEVGMSESQIEHITIFDPRGNDVTDSFIINTKPGTLRVYLYELRLTTPNITKTYDGLPLNASIHYQSQPQRGHFVSQLISTASNHVGTRENTVEIRISNEKGQDVTDQYWIEITYGTLTITPAELSVRADSCTKKYDGKPLECPSYVIGNGKLCQGHTIADIHIVGRITQIGRCDNMIMYVTIVDAEGQDVTKNYSITLLPGTLCVTYS